MIASLPRGATRRLYTAPHSLLDTFPTQLPRQLLDTAANDSPATAAMASSASGSKYQQAPHAGVVSNQTRCSDVNVLLERARISPVSSTASIQSSDSNNVVDSQRMAAATPHFGAKTSGIMTPGVSERRPVSGFPALDYAHPHGDDHPHDPVSGECNSRNQFPASPAAAMTTSRATRQLAGAQPRAGSRSEPQQQMGASHETSLATQSQHINQPRQHCSSSAQVKLPPSSEPTQRQDWHLEESHPQLSRHNLQGSAVMPSGHPASQLSTEPILASSIGAPLPVLEHRPQLEALAQDRPNLNQSTPGVVPHLSNTPVLSVNQSEGLATAGVESAASGGLWPSLATAGHQHSFSVVPVDSADDAPEAELSQRQQALRSLSSKGVQTSRTVSGKGDRTPRDGSSETTGKLSLGPASQGQPQMTTPMRSEAYFKAGYTKDVDGEGIRQPVAQKTGTVRALASQLNFRSDSSKHLN